MLPNSVVVEYDYDAASRLTGLTYTNTNTLLGDLTYTYDKAGRRLATAGSFARTGIPQAVNTATYNAANQQLTLGNQSMTYDLNGNLTTLTDPAGTTTYTWNARNQLVGISGPNVSASFQYDALGRRKQKTINGTITDFLYDGLNPVQELSGGNVVANLLTSRGIDEVWSRTEATGSRSFLADGLGSTLALTDAMGTIQTEYTYEPFGNTTVSGASSPNPFQYTGRENDGTGLYYYRARYYHPVLQRFISEDPIEFLGGDINLYRYVGNDPISFIDPYGLFQFSAFGNTVSVGVSGTFLPVNVGYDLGGFGAENFSLNSLFPPLSVGFGIDIQINPPGDCEKFVSPFVGFGRNLSIGTNVLYNPHTGSISTRGFNLSLGFSLGIPFGVQGPNAFR